MVAPVGMRAACSLRWVHIHTGPMPPSTLCDQVQACRIDGLHARAGLAVANRMLCSPLRGCRSQTFQVKAMLRLVPGCCSSSLCPEHMPHNKYCSMSSLFSQRYGAAMLLMGACCC